MDDIAIKVENLSKDFKLPHEKNNTIKSAVVNFWRRDRGYEIQHALKGIGFEVKRGEFFGIVGRNGSGKSTLLKLLAGTYTPTSGAVHVKGKLTPFIELGVGFNPELTGRENVYLNGALLGFNRKEMSAMYEDIVEFAELERFMDQKLKNYSSGMQVRLAFSIAIRAQSDILLIDEVLAVGDEAFQRKCFSYFKELKKNKRTVVFVSHDMGSVKEFCERGILIDGGDLKFSGSASEIAREYSAQFMGEESDKGLPRTKNKQSRRLGSGGARIKQVKVTVGAKEITVSTKAKAIEPVEELVYGLHIMGEDGRELTAMNNRMINMPDLKNLKPGTEVELEWKVMNIFGDGKYYIMLTLVDGSYNPLDFFEDAASFTVKRKERSNTSIIPPISVRSQVH